MADYLAILDDEAGDIEPAKALIQGFPGCQLGRVIQDSISFELPQAQEEEMRRALAKVGALLARAPTAELMEPIPISQILKGCDGEDP